MTTSRKTLETEITLSLSTENPEIRLHGLPPFYQHLLTCFFFYSGLGATLTLNEDNLPDFHHALEDFGIVLGQALLALKDTRDPVQRYATVYRSMDESLVRLTIDFSGRSGFYITEPDSLLMDDTYETLCEFYKALCRHLGACMHLDVLKAKNRHHLHEACFKALGEAIKVALSPTSHVQSTKGGIDGCSPLASSTFK